MKVAMHSSQATVLPVKTTRIMVVDDHPLVRKAIANSIEQEPDLEIIAEASDGEEAVKLALELVPDIIFMDITIPKINGIEATRIIKHQCSSIAVIILSVHSDPMYTFGALNAGADGYLTKTILDEEIVRAIRSLLAGDSILSGSVYRDVIKQVIRNASTEPVENMEINLGVREIAILIEVAKGSSNKEIAQKLGISVRTVKGYLGEIFYKLDVCSRTEAVIKGLKSGVFTISDLA